MAELRIVSAPGLLHLIVLSDTYELLDYALWYPGNPDQFGDIHYGRVTACLPAIGGAFVQLTNSPISPSGSSSGSSSGFLPDNAGAKGLHIGDKVIVRITRSAQGGKGVRLDTRNLEEFQKNPPASLGLIQSGISPLEELAKRWKTLPIILDAPHLIEIIPSALRSRSRFSTEAVSETVLQQVQALQEISIDLPNGLTASLTPTPALTAIDMDSAGQSQENQNKMRAQFTANRNALPFLLRQLRLRNLSGAILLDMVGLPIRKRRLLQQDIETALAEDPLCPRLLGFTHLGLAEITRPRKRPPLHEQLTSDHGQAIQILGELAQDFQSRIDRYACRKIRLKLSIPCHQALLRDSWAIRDFETRCSIALAPESDPALTGKKWEFSYEK